MKMVQETNYNKKLQNYPISIYIHIPFCERKCNYCDFLSAPASKKEQKRYVKALLAEIEYWGKAFWTASVKSVYFGGGTPSILQPEVFEEILCKLKQHFPDISKNTSKMVSPAPEISMEVNPGTVTEEKLTAYKEAGINRLSIGLQSADNRELKLLGRIHTYEEFLETYALVRKCGFENVNVDLMSALPGQQVKDWQNTLEKVMALEPEHISAYSLIIEEGTPFFDKYAGKEELLPDEETDRTMYELTKTMLLDGGYERYEISNYSKKGKECVHNIVYWQRGNYIGLGLGSSSMIENVRFQNTDDFESYVNYWTESPKRVRRDANRLPETVVFGKNRFVIPDMCREIQRLTRKEQMEEFMFLGLRMTKGVSPKEFEALFGKDIFDIYGKQIENFQKQKLLTVSDRIALTDKGIDVSNIVLAEFLLS